jgi:cytochrome c biogenesis protein CcmG, thiol:disulfide interchange protein DsbE
VKPVTAAVIAVLAVLAAACGGGHPAGTSAHNPSTANLRKAAHLPPCPRPSGHGDLPAVALDCLAGGPAVRLDGLTGRPTVVNLWASWCGPCREELPAFNRLAATGKVRVIGVASDDDLRSALSYAGALKLDFPSLLDEHGALKARLGVPGLPATVLLDGQGRIVRRHPGQLTDASLADLLRTGLGITT